MSRSPAPAGAAAAPPGSPAEERAAARVGRALEAVFEAVAETAAETAALLARVAVGGRCPATADLAALRPGLHRRLAGGELVSGVGFVAAPGLLADVPAWLEWWQSTARGDVRPLLPDLDPGRSAYADYTHWDWFALPRDTGLRAVAGPYVDYLCSDEYSLTLSVPVELAGRFAGVAAADVYLRHFEAAVLPLLRELPGAAHLVNARGRVAASADPSHLAGSLTRGPDFGAVLERARPAAADGRRLVPCRSVPLVLVVSER
ncbi:cache domain-containing protein [Streptomyces tropicalis]|uniref:Cache domain-containing protein n=1 Tax=Streptomyces tropicalis TaxID=3034234 RepID=A0ABT6ABR2_9ACTN|nr:cache domain-containing protein [Streptomyces tropicalis]MDF3302094.1 cache domain-containing protein [Streptomyces tropicalis]